MNTFAWVLIRKEIEVERREEEVNVYLAGRITLRAHQKALKIQGAFTTYTLFSSSG